MEELGKPRREKNDGWGKGRANITTKKIHPAESDREAFSF